jgi:hypothetical protein
VEKEVTCQKIPNRMDKVEAFERAAIWPFFFSPKKNIYVILINTIESLTLSYKENCGFFQIFLRLEENFPVESQTCSIIWADRELFSVLLSCIIKKYLGSIPWDFSNMSAFSWESVFHPNWPQLSFLIKPHKFSWAKGALDRHGSALHV